MDKIVKTRKDHKCAYCGKTILKGSTACYMEGRHPKYEVKGFEEKQIGIEYFKVYYCYGAEGDNMPSCAGEDDDTSESNCTIHGVVGSAITSEKLQQLDHEVDELLDND
jgi:hypothetical protein